MSDSQKILTTILELAEKHGASYAEARLVRYRQEQHVVVDGDEETAYRHDSAGLGIRLLINGGWGFAATAHTDDASLKTATKRAAAIAKASAQARRSPIALAAVQPVRAEHRMLGRIDPFSVPISERLALLHRAHAAMSAVSGVVQTKANMDLRREYVEVMTSEGAHVLQETSVVGGGVAATGESAGGRATRSYPHHGGWDYAVAGYEWFDGLNMAEAGARVAREAVEFSRAKPCPQGKMTVVFDPTMIGMVLHETLGHPAELDRVLRDELDNFGPSFMTPDKVNRFPYGSPLVSLTADATIPGAAGSFAFDDEGVPSQRFSLITNGVLSGYLMSRESAARIHRPSNGTSRASSWSRMPMVRITNLVLEPGTSSKDALIGEVDDGIYIETFRTADIDDKRLLCSFGGEIGWRIRHGRLVEPVKTPIVFTNTPDLWRQCDGIGYAAESRLTGIAECGKGLPWQFIRTGQGGPPARFRNVEVGLP
ncbi:MAG: TldD/PmbA family protein [Armatimonadetes bacterium]|nr:TldD/PmbA family protein [Armatimonadota bacterium]